MALLVRVRKREQGLNQRASSFPTCELGTVLLHLLAVHCKQSKRCEVDKPGAALNISFFAAGLVLLGQCTYTVRRQSSRRTVKSSLTVCTLHSVTDQLLSPQSYPLLH